MLGRNRFSLGMRLWRRWLPELGLFEPGDRQRRALRRAVANWQTNLCTLALAAGFLLNTFYLLPLLCSHYGLPTGIVYTINILASSLIALSGIWLTRSRIRRRLRQELINDGFTICGLCGYDLRGSADRCPECGTPMQ